MSSLDSHDAVNRQNYHTSCLEANIQNTLHFCGCAGVISFVTFVMIIIGLIYPGLLESDSAGALQSCGMQLTQGLFEYRVYDTSTAGSAHGVLNTTTNQCVIAELSTGAISCAHDANDPGVPTTEMVSSGDTCSCSCLQVWNSIYQNQHNVASDYHARDGSGVAFLQYAHTCNSDSTCQSIRGLYISAVVFIGLGFLGIFFSCRNKNATYSAAALSFIGGVMCVATAIMISTHWDDNKIAGEYSTFFANPKFGYTYIALWICFALAWTSALVDVCMRAMEDRKADHMVAEQVRLNREYGAPGLRASQDERGVSGGNVGIRGVGSQDSYQAGAAVKV